MRLVERVGSERGHIVVNLVRDFRRHAVRHRALYIHAVVVQAAQEHFAFVFHLLFLLLAHHSAHFVRAPERIARDVLHDTHDLFLINHDAERDFQRGNKQRMVVMNLVGVMLVLDINRDLVDRPRTEQRNTCHDFFERRGLQVAHELFHALGLELEYGVRVAFAYEFIGVLVVVLPTSVVEIDGQAAVLLDILQRFADIGDGAKSQKVHFE